MKCPKCGFVQADYNNKCKKCSKDLVAFKEKLGIRASAPPTPSPRPKVDLEAARKAEQDRLAMQRAQLELEKQRKDQAEKAQEEARKLAEERKRIEDEQKRIRAERIALEAQKELEVRRLEEERLKREKLQMEHEHEQLRLDKLRLEAEREKEEQRLAEEKRRLEELKLKQEKQELERIRKEEEQERTRVEAERKQFEEEKVKQEIKLKELDHKKQELEESRSAAEKAVEQRKAFDAEINESSISDTEAAAPDFPPQQESEPPEPESESAFEDEAKPDVVVVEKGGFIRRFFAGAVDMALISVALLLFLLVGQLVFSWGTPGKDGMGLGAFLLLTLPVYILTVILAAGYFTYFHASIGQTPGKKLFALRVVDLYGQVPRTSIAFLRFVAGTFSLLLMGMGFFWIGLDLNKQGWHDKIAQTVVIRV